MIRIKSQGTGRTTQVELEDGTIVPGVVKIEILPITAPGMVKARLTFECVQLDLLAENSTS